jgi:diguanylate cyclase (GGDEF)-like protein
VELTQLAPGSYTLHARTTGPSGELSPEIRWSFVVLRPWYRSWPALVVWVALAIGGLRAYGRLKSRRVRARARELKAEVAEKTGELQRTVEELSRTRDELETANVRLEDLSLHDSLTGLHNRRMIDRAFTDEWERARRHRTPIAVIVVDVDHFKLLNDTRGHREGDECLRAIASHLAATIVRAGDVVGRFGGEEFAILLPNTALAGAMHVAEQLRAGIEALALHHPSVPSGRITASFGVASTVPRDGELSEALLEAADRALYRAKSEGRNRVCAAG